MTGPRVRHWRLGSGSPRPGGATVVALHAHPDDESLLTGGTLAGLAASGHRVVVITATDGAQGLTGSATTSEHLGDERVAELLRAAGVLGVDEVVTLGFADSGSDPRRLRPDGFCHESVEATAQIVAGIVAELGADVLLGYDSAGGYGHPDHLMVYQVGRRAAEIAGCPYLGATAPHRLMRLLMRVAGVVPGLRSLRPPTSDAAAWSDADAIGLTIDVRPWVAIKQRALRAHRSQMSGGVRTVAVLARLPRPLARLALGREWFTAPDSWRHARGGPESLLPPGRAPRHT